jgi:hypothetical protein
MDEIDAGPRAFCYEQDFDMRRLGRTGARIPIEHQAPRRIENPHDAEFHFGAVCRALVEATAGLDGDGARRSLVWRRSGGHQSPARSVSSEKARSGRQGRNNVFSITGDLAWAASRARARAPRACSERRPRNCRERSAPIENLRRAPSRDSGCRVRSGRRAPRTRGLSDGVKSPAGSPESAAPARRRRADLFEARSECRVARGCQAHPGHSR